MRPVREKEKQRRAPSTNNQRMTTSWRRRTPSKTTLHGKRKYGGSHGDVCQICGNRGNEHQEPHPTELLLCARNELHLEVPRMALLSQEVATHAEVAASSLINLIELGPLVLTE